MTLSANPQSTTPTKSNPGTIPSNNLDFCRFFLALLVIFSHSFALAIGHDRDEPLGVLTSHQLNSGELAVCCFFAISGYLIAHSWLRTKTIGDFIWKRILRIYPGFIAVNLFDYFVVAPLASSKLEFGSKKPWMIAVDLALLRRLESPGCFPDNPYPGAINGSLWSIPYEFKCYLILMLLGSLGLLGRPRWRIIALGVVVMLCGALYPYVALNVLERGAFAVIVGTASQWFHILPYFLAGTVYYVFRDQIVSSRSIVLLAACATAVACIIPPLGQIAFPVTITFLLFWIAFHPWIRLHQWSKYGDFSYGIYLYAFPIQQLIVMHIPGISPMALFGVSAPLSIFAGILSWELVEKRFLRFKKHAPVPRESGKPPKLSE